MDTFQEMFLGEKSKKRKVRKGRDSKKGRKVRFSKKAKSMLPNIVQKVAKGKK